MKHSEYKFILPVGIDDFKKVISGGYVFADKSLFIKDVMEDGTEVVVITRPRRFGKTLNLSMLYYFLQQNHASDENLFENLNISKNIEFCQQHQQQYPVIYISFKDIAASSFDDSYADITVLMQRLYESHSYLLEGTSLSESEKITFESIRNKKADKPYIKAALALLSEYMTKKFKKTPIILIDEYDTPIQEAYLKGYYSEMIELMRSILGQALKGNTYLRKAIVTGISRVARESIFSGMNNVEVYSLLREEYGQYFGFTEEEVSRLIVQTGKKVPLGPIKEWYNGYQIGKHVLYNPWSIINCLKNHGKLEAYWLNTSSNALIAKLLNNAGQVVKQYFEELLQGNIIERPLSENLVFLDIGKKEAALWTLLLYAGYLKVLSSDSSSGRLMAKIAIPNKEITIVYDETFREWFNIETSLDSYNKFVQSLAKGDLDEFKKQLSSYLMQTASYFDFNQNTPESVFQSFVLGLIVGLRDNYIIQSNLESGLGRFDVIFIPKNQKSKGILLEFKVSNTPELLLVKSQEALKQIKDKKYIETFKQHHVHSVLAIGLAFCGKQVELAHEDLLIKSR